MITQKKYIHTYIHTYIHVHIHTYRKPEKELVTNDNMEGIHTYREPERSLVTNDNMEAPGANIYTYIHTYIQGTRKGTCHK